MRVVSFFSGAGGMDLGFAFAGHDIVWSNDFDKDAVETYNKNIGLRDNKKSILADIVELLNTTKNNIDKIIPESEIIIGGFPCQGFSIANIERDMTDSRNFLYEQLLKAISVKQPKYFLLENVKGLENMERGRVLAMILDDLEAAGTKSSKYFPNNSGCGYKVFYGVLNALNFGVPQNRERVIIVGIRNDIEMDNNIHKYIVPPFENTKYDKRKRFFVEGEFSKDSNLKSPLNPIEKSNILYKKFLNSEVFDFKGITSKYKYTTLADIISDLPDEFDDSIKNHVGSYCKVKISNRVGNRPTDWNRHSPTIMGRGSGTGGPLIPPHPNLKRRLSVRETARIQTFPDNFEFYGSNSAAYRQIGNAVPVLMAFEIAKIFKNT